MAASAGTRDQERLVLLVRAGEIFHQSLDVAATLNNVAKVAVETFADLCLFDLLDDQSERLFVTASAHRDPSMEDALASVSTILYVEEFGVHPVVQVTRTGQPFFLPHIDEETLVRHSASRQHEQYMRRFGYRSKIVVPVTAQNRLFGALTFVRTSELIEFDQADLLFAIELGRRAGVAVANAKQFHREQYVAETLQRSFLPREFPSRQNLEISAYYRPGSTEADVGGDWYDAFENERGHIVITIGDVTGKGIEAARFMVFMRQAIRVAALDALDPRHIASVCNRLLLAEIPNRFASAFVGILDPSTRRLRYVSAGHPPPLMRSSNREVFSLKPPSAPLGAFRDVEFAEHEIFCPPGSALVLYTDGIIEVSRDVAMGQEALTRVVASNAFAHAANQAEFVERAIGSQPPRDDIAILVLTFGRAEQRWRFEAADARAAHTMREKYYETLINLCRPSEKQLADCGLIFSELIGNAVRYAAGALSVTLQILEKGVILHVIDVGPGFDYDASLPSDLWAEGGRGLFLISKLAGDVCVERLPGLGSHVSVKLPIVCRHG
ncbi:MAG: SpoIIE family protein phosphatase [Candidatus Baltobacteraceae bacterium]